MAEVWAWVGGLLIGAAVGLSAGARLWLTPRDSVARWVNDGYERAHQGRP